MSELLLVGIGVVIGALVAPVAKVVRAMYEWVRAKLAGGL